MAGTELPSDVLTALSLRFQITGELGRGGMGAVLKGHDRELGREVAIKLLPASISRVLGADRFAQEIRLTARLVHPNIVPLFSSGEAAGCLYFVMPLIEGGTLRQRLHPTSSSFPEIPKATDCVVTLRCGGGVEVVPNRSHRLPLSFGMPRAKHKQPLHLVTVLRP